MRRGFAIVNKAEPARGGGTFDRGFSYAQVARRIVKITVVHESGARAVASLKIAANQRGQQLSADKLACFAIIGPDHVLIILSPSHHVLHLFGDGRNSSLPSAVRNDQ
jgi:hypothetical protein